MRLFLDGDNCQASCPFPFARAGDLVHAARYSDANHSSFSKINVPMELSKSGTQMFEIRTTNLSVGPN